MIPCLSTQNRVSRQGNILHTQWSDLCYQFFLLLIIEVFQHQFPHHMQLLGIKLWFQRLFLNHMNRSGKFITISGIFLIFSFHRSILSDSKVSFWEAIVSSVGMYIRADEIRLFFNKISTIRNYVKLNKPFLALLIGWIPAFFMVFFLKYR